MDAIDRLIGRVVDAAYAETVAEHRAKDATLGIEPLIVLQQARVTRAEAVEQLLQAQPVVYLQGMPQRVA